MKNSELLFLKAKKYQDERAAITTEYEKKIKSLESAKGSRFYENESQKATDKRDTALTALKKAFYTSANVILEDMEKVNSSRTFEAPTDEEMAIISALKMRDKISATEIETAANSLISPLALSLLREVAEKNGYRKHIDSPSDLELPVSTVSDMIRSLSSSIADFVEHDSTRASRAAREHKERFYGLGDADNTELPKRKPFDTVDGFFYEVAPYLSSERKAAFFAATDGE